MQTPALMERAQQRVQEPEQDESQSGFKRPDTAQFVPKDKQDAYARVIAAGQKLMYSPAMRDDLQREIQRDVPVAQKMAEAVTGLMLTMDKQSKGGLPMEVIFPAGLELLSEAASVLIAAGQPVTQEDWNEAARQMFVIMARKFGAKDDDIMGSAEKALGGGGEMEPGEGPGHEQAEPAPVEQQETQAEAQGMPEPDEQMPGQPMRRA